MQDVVITTPTTRHKATVIMLHAMYGGPHDYDRLCTRLATRGVKSIALAAPQRLVHWPGGAECGVTAWYDYYTCRDGEAQHDIINERQLDQQAMRVHDTIQAELKHTDVPVMLLGSSQGGTVVLRTIALCDDAVDAVICLRTCYLHNIPVTTCPLSRHASQHRRLPRMFIFSGEKDEVYTLSLQRGSYAALYRLLHRTWMRPTWTIVDDLRHSEFSPVEEQSALRFICGRI